MAKYPSYIKVNKLCYNTIAGDYEARFRAGLVAKHLVRIITKVLKKNINKENYRILELGCGTGNIFAGFMELPDKEKYQLYGIDFSENMIKYAKDKHTTANIENQNVLSIKDISSLPFASKDKFDIIIMVALIHLFPREDAKKILNNIKKILNTNGLIYIDTTEESNFIDGEITDKKITDREGNVLRTVKRLRTEWTEKKFEDFLDECGFDIEFIHNKNHEDDRGKIWLQRIAKIKSK